VPAIVVFLNKCDMVEDAELLELWNWKVPRAAQELPVSRRHDSGNQGLALQALNGDAKWEKTN